MNKKTINSILVILLLFIWGSVVYKYFGKSHKSSTEQFTSNTIVKPNLNYNIEKDTFKLNLNSRDPFKTSKRIRNTNSPYVKKQASKKTKKKDLKWPKIEYYGFVKGKNNNTKLALLKVNNKLYRKREREKIEVITIKKAYSDSIVITLNRNNKTFTRK